MTHAAHSRRPVVQGPLDGGGDTSVTQLLFLRNPILIVLFRMYCRAATATAQYPWLFDVIDPGAAAECYPGWDPLARRYFPEDRVKCRLCGQSAATVSWVGGAGQGTSSPGFSDINRHYQSYTPQLSMAGCKRTGWRSRATYYKNSAKTSGGRATSCFPARAPGRAFVLQLSTESSSPVRTCVRRPCS